MTNKQPLTLKSTAAIHTLQPVRLMTRLCKHWGHKFPVELGEQQGSIELPLGLCHMRCTDILQVLRLIWAATQKNNRPEQDPSTAFLVKAGHGLLYLGMLLLPITGLMIMIGNGYGWNPFGLGLIARGGAEIGWLATLGSAHSLIAWSLLILVLGHAGIALLHHFVKKDGVLRRML